LIPCEESGRRWTSKRPMASLFRNACLPQLQPPGCSERRGGRRRGMRAAMQQTVAAGADWIKLVVAGGVNAPDERATMALYTEAEVAVAMTEARAPSTPVAVAAYGGPSVRFSAGLGANTIEHCALFDNDALDAVVERHATLVLTHFGGVLLLSDTCTYIPKRSFCGLCSLSGLHASDVYEIVGDHAEPDPTRNSVVTFGPTAIEIVSPLGHADASLASGPPFLAVAETRQ
jgi:hypothetical protein